MPLGGTPLCMDYKDGYLAIGTNDGKVLFHKGTTGMVIDVYWMHIHITIHIHA